MEDHIQQMAERLHQLDEHLRRLEEAHKHADM
jgi:hypothetical protein